MLLLHALTHMQLRRLRRVRTAGSTGRHMARGAVLPTQAPPTIQGQAGTATMPLPVPELAQDQVVGRARPGAPQLAGQAWVVHKTAMRVAGACHLGACEGQGSAREPQVMGDEAWEVIQMISLSGGQVSSPVAGSRGLWTRKVLCVTSQTGPPCAQVIGAHLCTLMTAKTNGCHATTVPHVRACDCAPAPWLWVQQVQSCTILCAR